VTRTILQPWQSGASCLDWQPAAKDRKGIEKHRMLLASAPTCFQIARRTRPMPVNVTAYYLRSRTTDFCHGMLRPKLAHSPALGALRSSLTSYRLTCITECTKTLLDLGVEQLFAGSASFEAHKRIKQRFSTPSRVAG
jgi:hypothetical protein